MRAIALKLDRARRNSCPRLTLGEQDADSIREPFLSAAGELPHVTKKSAIVNGADLIDHDVGLLFETCLTCFEMDTEKTGLRLDVRCQGTDHGGRVNWIQ